MGRQIGQIQVQHHQMLLDCRSQDRLVQSESFSEAWEQAAEVHRVIALIYIKQISPVALRFWVSDVLAQGALDQLNMVTLRHIASTHQVKNYSRMSKVTIIQAIEEKGVKFDSQNKLRIAAKSTGRGAFDTIDGRRSAATDQHTEEEISD